MFFFFLKFFLCTLINKINLPSRLMPILRHFFSRQCWHWFRWCWSTGQLRFPRHWYVKFRLTDRLKKLLQPEIWTDVNITHEAFTSLLTNSPVLFLKREIFFKHFPTDYTCQSHAAPSWCWLETVFIIFHDQTFFMQSLTCTLNEFSNFPLSHIWPQNDFIYSLQFNFDCPRLFFGANAGSSMVKLLCSEVGVATIQMNIWHLSSIIFCLQMLGGEQKDLDAQLTQFIT